MVKLLCFLENGGSGKTFFWKNIIEKELIQNQTEKQKAYVYSSLYGNRTLDKIEDNIYAQAYLCSVGGKNAVLSGYEKVKDFGKRFGSFCSLLDVSKLVDGIDDIQQKNIKRSALSYLENGGIVCFDDFERKSKDIDLNDLFGFISHLAIDLNCKVVIILNDDVFEGEEKNVFSRVKEKSVSKFLKYEPSIKELFETIFSNEKYRVLDEHKEIILKTIEETEELNARIYIQVLDNLVEWIEKEQEINDDVLRCLILVNINFILFHTICNHKVENIYLLRGFYDIHEKYSNNFSERGIGENLKLLSTFQDYYSKLKESIFSGKEKPEEKRKYHNNFLESNLKNYESKFLANKLDISKDVDNKTFQKINKFIETGILINE
ncbi:putative membrane protein [Arcobacter acticola]|uniref:Putative membrane protein n=1 Tax=Arcobacter acticola TaxID=1849015 RepID=A0A6M8EE51_9BACT|nr:hypothetical protein [Arcobacter acticola]QKE29853.1 putative membrane protein [Arcobacter acticola]